MKICSCGNRIPYSVIIDGVRRTLSNRSKCLKCQPYKSSVYSVRYADSERKEKELEKNRRKQKSYRKRVANMGIVDSVKEVNELRRSRKALVISVLGGSCMLCGYSRCQRNLTFHHIENKSFSLAEREFQFSWKKLLPEICKCVLICHNCHGEVHDGVVAKEVISALSAHVLTAMSTFTPPNQKRERELKNTCKRCGRPCARIFCSHACAHATHERIIWPAPGDLSSMVAASSLSQVGRELGVSATSVKKRMLRYK